jgi:hypothetical protein
LGINKELILKMRHVFLVLYGTASDTTQPKLSYANNLLYQFQAAWLQAIGNEMEIPFCNKMMKTVSV